MFARHKKHPLKFAVLVLLAISLTAWSSATAWDECTVDLYYDLYQAVVDIRLLTPCEPPDFTPDDAYDFQESFVERFEDELVGYKLGLTCGGGDQCQGAGIRPFVQVDAARKQWQHLFV